MSSDVHQNDAMLSVKYVGELFFHFSVLSRLLIAVSWWRRLLLVLPNRVYRCWGKRDACVPSGPIFAFERKQSLLTVIHVAQKESFRGVLEALKTGDCHEINAGKHGARVKGAFTPLQKYCPFYTRT